MRGERRKRGTAYDGAFQGLSTATPWSKIPASHGHAEGSFTCTVPEACPCDIGGASPSLFFWTESKA